MTEIIQTYWLQLLVGYYPQGPLGGLAFTVVLAMGALLATMPTAILIVLGLIGPWRWLRILLELFVFYMRGVPLMVHLLWAYVLIPLLLGKSIPLWVTLLAVLILFNAAYLSQSIRAGIDALARGQYEAGRSLGLGHAACLRLVIFPQALRNVTPSIVNQLVLLIKETALGSVIGMDEMTREFMTLNDILRGHSAQIFVLLGLTYFTLCYPLTVLGRWLEGRFALPHQTTVVTA